MVVYPNWWRGVTVDHLPQAKLVGSNPIATTIFILTFLINNVIYLKKITEVVRQVEEIVLKKTGPQGLVGSIPTASAIFNKRLLDVMEACCSGSAVAQVRFL